MNVSEEKKKCANPACDCEARSGSYCSEQCRDGSTGNAECNCGHIDCG